MTYLTQAERDQLERLQSKQNAPPATLEEEAKAALEEGVRAATAQGGRLVTKRPQADDEFTTAEIADHIMRRRYRPAPGEVRFDESVDEPTIDRATLAELEGGIAMLLSSEARDLRSQSIALHRQQAALEKGELAAIDIPDPDDLRRTVHVPGSPSFLLHRNAQAIAAHRREIQTFNAKPAAARETRRALIRAGAMREAINEKKAMLGGVG